MCNSAWKLIERHLENSTIIIKLYNRLFFLVLRLAIFNANITYFVFFMNYFKHGTFQPCISNTLWRELKSPLPPALILKAWRGSNWTISQYDNLFLGNNLKKVFARILFMRITHRLRELVCSWWQSAHNLDWWITKKVVNFRLTHVN